LAEVMTGKFCSSFAPVSGSFESFAVTPSTPDCGMRLMLRPVFEKIEFCVRWFPTWPSLPKL
jgi:hypothetical protein